MVRTLLETVLVGTPLTALLIGAGVLIERRLRGPRGEGEGAGPGERAYTATVLLRGYLAVVLLLFTPYYLEPVGQEVWLVLEGGDGWH